MIVAERPAEVAVTARLVGAYRTVDTLVGLTRTLARLPDRDAFTASRRETEDEDAHPPKRCLHLAKVTRARSAHHDDAHGLARRLPPRQDPHMRESSIVPVLLEAIALKDVARAGWLRVGVERPESVAAHSWGVAWLVLALCPEHLDRGRALALALLHDLAEVRVGDVTPHDGVPREEKRRLESEAFASMVAPLPHAAELCALFAEVEDASTPEGRFVKACDRLDMGLQARRYAAAGHDTSEHLASAREALSVELQALLAP